MLFSTEIIFVLFDPYLSKTLSGM